MMFLQMFGASFLSTFTFFLVFAALGNKINKNGDK